VKDQGIEYLASMAAAEIARGTGAPVEFTEPQLKALAKSALDKMGEKRAGAGPHYDWLLPYAGFEPAAWSLTLKKDDALSVGPGVHLLTKHYGLYEGTDALIPTEFPSSEILRIPIVLRPSFAGIKAPLCYTKLSGEVTCWPTTIFSKPTCVWQVPAPELGKYTNEVYPCLDHTLAVYYRNAWIVTKFVPTKCAVLHASAVQIGESLGLPWPFDKPFLDVALLTRHLPAIWDGWLYANCK
jgi:hypothetical protein